eukprot:8615594-Pyramimonas_sp.AAC.1
MCIRDSHRGNPCCPSMWTTGARRRGLRFAPAPPALPGPPLAVSPCGSKSIGSRGGLRMWVNQPR